MSELNPYAPPETNPVPSPQPGQDQPLASPWTRLGAMILDMLIALIACIPVAWILSRFGIAGSSWTATSNSFAFRAEGFSGTIIFMAVWIAINWSALQNGQTIGKKIARLRIVRKDGSGIPALRIITHRMLPVQLIALVPFIGALAVLVDALCIFRPGRNTLHDDIADTKVIKL